MIFRPGRGVCFERNNRGNGSRTCFDSITSNMRYITFKGRTSRLELLKD